MFERLKAKTRKSDQKKATRKLFGGWILSPQLPPPTPSRGNAADYRTR
jgi:hypothetical protein